MCRGSVLGRRHVEFAWVGLGVGDEFGNGLGRNRWIHLRDVRKADETRNRRDVADEIETQLVVERRVDCICWSNKQERVAVGGACTTASVAMLVLAPGRFSITKVGPAGPSAIAPSSAR
jgi:hypothetical protein